MYHNLEEIQVRAANVAVDIIGLLPAAIPTTMYFLGYPMTSWGAAAGIITTVGFAFYRVYDREAMRSVEKSLKKEEARQLKIANDEREFALSEKKQSQFRQITCDLSKDDYAKVSELERAIEAIVKG